MVLRELVTKLSFQFDRTNLDKFENSIVGFKSKFAIAGASLTAFAKKIYNFVSDISDSALAGNDLADAARVSADEFFALENALKKVGISQDSFRGKVSEISHDLLEASRGFGKFYEIARQTNNKVTFKNIDGSLKNVRQVLEDVASHIQSLPSQSEKLRFLGNFFSPEEAATWLRLFSGGADQFSKLVDKEKEFAKALADSKQQTISFKNETEKLFTEWSNLTTLVGLSLVPYIAQAAKGYNEIIQSVKTNGSLQTAIDVVSVGEKVNRDNLLDFALGGKKREDLTHLEALESFGRDLERVVDFLGSQASSLLNSAKNVYDNVTINNTFEITAPNGQVDGQASAFIDEVRSVIRQENDRMIQEVFINSPQVE